MASWSSARSIFLALQRDRIGSVLWDRSNQGHPCCFPSIPWVVKGLLTAFLHLFYAEGMQISSCPDSVSSPSFFYSLRCSPINTGDREWGWGKAADILHLTCASRNGWWPLMSWLIRTPPHSHPLTVLPPITAVHHGHNPHCTDLCPNHCLHHVFSLVPLC